MSTLSMVQIIDETIKFYGDDTTRRSKRGNGDKVGDNVCAYNGADGKHCAVGRCLTKEALKLNPDRHDDTNVGSVWSTIELLDHDLQPQYRGHSIQFWESLQGLHDGDANWNARGMTDIGRRNALGLMSRFMR